MIKILFWNINKRRLDKLLNELLDAHNPDIIVLAECPESLGELHEMLLALNEYRYPVYRPYINPSRRLVTLVKLPLTHFEEVLTTQESRQLGDKVAIYRVQPFVGKELLLVGVHLPSKLNASDDTQADLATRLRPIIEEKEAIVEHRRTVVIGDLNMDPFERGVVSTEALHAIMDAEIIKQRKGVREIQGGIRRFFYNPMWSRLGDGRPRVPGGQAISLDLMRKTRADNVRNQYPPGTYYYASGESSAYYWHTFDQVLLRLDLLSKFQQEDVQILTSTGLSSLQIAANGQPDDTNASDHFPLLVKVNTL